MIRSSMLDVQMYLTYLYCTIDSIYDCTLASPPPKCGEQLKVACM